MIRGLIHKFRDPAWVRKEFWQMFRYGIVGGASTLLFLGLYALFSRVLWPQANPTLLDAVALTISAVFNFTLHRIWSFKANGFNFGMVRRYVVTIIASSIVQVGLFHVGTAWIGLRDFYVQIALVPIIAFLQYLAHRMFTFHRRFEAKGAQSSGLGAQGAGDLSARASGLNARDDSAVEQSSYQTSVPNDPTI